MMQGDQKYIFVLGREREIALAELKAVLNRLGFCFDLNSVSGNLAVLNMPGAIDSAVKGLIDILGGTIKIFRVTKSGRDDELCQQRTTDIASSVIPAEAGIHDSRFASQCLGSPGHGLRLPEDDINRGAQYDIKNKSLKKKIAAIILQERQGQSGKLDFGISSFTRGATPSEINRLGLEVKSELKHKGIGSRSVALREGTELSSIVSLKNKLVDKGIEIGLFEQGVGILIALNNPEGWSIRDYEKPAGDKYSGMVPPKLARMLVNIALSDVKPKAQTPKPKENQNNKGQKSSKVFALGSGFLVLDHCVVADPFCGSGNILMEAMMLGCDVIGSDISEKAVRDTKENLEWLCEQVESGKRKAEGSRCNFSIHQANATEVDFSKILSTLYSLPSTLCVVTEPYLGQPKKFEPTYNSARGEYGKIKDSYLAFLKNLSTLHLPLSTICIVFPLVETSDKGRFSVYGNSVDEIKDLGYTEIRQPLIYGREYQVVKRQIAFLQLTN